VEAAPSPPPSSSIRHVTLLEWALFGLSAAGVPVGMVLPRRLGRLGGLLVEAAAIALWVRAIAMIVAGTPARLRVVPQLLLFTETAIDGLTMVVGFGAWVCRPFRRPQLFERVSNGAPRRRTATVPRGFQSPSSPPSTHHLFHLGARTSRRLGSLVHQRARDGKRGYRWRGAKE
jgi:hypothetical protein